MLWIDVVKQPQNIVKLEEKKRILRKIWMKYILSLFFVGVSRSASFTSGKVFS